MNSPNNGSDIYPNYYVRPSHGQNLKRKLFIDGRSTAIMLQEDDVVKLSSLDLSSLIVRIVISDEEHRVYTGNCAGAMQLQFCSNTTTCLHRVTSIGIGIRFVLAIHSIPKHYRQHYYLSIDLHRSVGLLLNLLLFCAAPAALKSVAMLRTFNALQQASNNDFYCEMQY